MSLRTDNKSSFYSNVIVLSALAVIILYTSGCAEKKTPPEKSKQQVFVFNNGAEPETLDPALMTGVPEHTLALALFEGLTTYNTKDLSAQPGMAERWDVSEDGLVYTFHLRKARWSNKDEVTADDFIYSWERVLNPGTASDYAYQLYYLKNARDYNAGKIKDFSQVGVHALDKLTLQVTLEKPTIYFLELTSFDTLMPVNKRCVKEHGNQWTRPGKIVTNGPFLLKEWKPYQQILMVKNPDYWDADNVKLDAIVAVSIEDNDTGLKMYLAGETDWIRGIPLAQLEVMKARPDYYAMPILATYFYRFNVKKPPFNDLKVRQAFNLAVDKESLVQYVTKAGQIPARTFVPPNIPGYNAPEGAGFNPDKAKRLLSEAGYLQGHGFPKVELLYNTSEGHRKIAEALQEMWKKTLGVEIELVNKEWKVYLKDVSTLNYSISRAG